MTNIGAIFSSVKNAPTQKPVHLLISTTIQILDEGNNHSLPALYLIGISALETLISSMPQVLNIDTIFNWH